MVREMKRFSWDAGLIDILLKEVSVHVFGAGCWGSLVVKGCIFNSINIKTIIVSDASKNISEIYKIPVKESSSFSKMDEVVLVAVEGADGIEICNDLENNGFSKVFLLNTIPIELQGYEFNSQLPRKFYYDEIKLLYWFRTKREINVLKPKSFNEKLQIIKIRKESEELWKYADKYTVREYVRDLIGDRYLVKLIGEWETVAQIDFESLPTRFVMKCTHGSGYNYICSDKSIVDKKSVMTQFDTWMHENYAYYGFELQYLKIQPRIIAEEYVCDIDSKDTVNDYKIYVFGGKAKYIHVDIDRFGNHRRVFYNSLWERVNIEYTYPNDTDIDISKPDNLNEMIEIAEKLGADFCFVRIDLYRTIEGIKFGEMTFSPDCGFGVFSSETVEDEWGEWISEL